MYSLYADIVSRNQPEKTDTDDIVESDTIENLYRLSEDIYEVNPEVATDTSLFDVCHLILRDVFRLFESQNDNQAFQRLTQVESLAKEFGSAEAKTFVGFHVNRLRAFGFAWSDMHLKAVKASNKSIAHCPVVNGARAKGLVDILILISESYSAMNKFEDAAHSAKLAVDIAHDHLEKSVDETFVNGGSGVAGESTIGGVRTYLGPLLDSPLLLAVAYYNLGTQLRQGGMVEASVAWYEKAIRSAESYGVEEGVVSVLLAGLAEAERHLDSLDFASGGNIQAHDTIVDDRISRGMDGLERESGEGQHRESSHVRGRSAQSEGRQPSRPRVEYAGSQQKPSSSLSNTTSSSERDAPFIDRRYEDVQHERGYTNPVESMTNNSTIPTQTQPSAGGAINNGRGGGARGLKVKSKRHDAGANSTNDDISHITGDDDNQREVPHYFFPTRPRPKSAVSKLGGNTEDASSVTSGASTPKRMQQKRHSIGGGGTPRVKGRWEGDGQSSSSLASNNFEQYHQLQPGQLYDNSEFNRIVVERSMEWNGHGDSTDVPATTMERLLSSDTKDPALRSVKDTLSKQLEGMIKFREKVQAHKTEVREQELAIQSRQRKEAKDAAKSDRRRVLSTAVEMNFERRCAHDDRVGLYDSILRAQRLKAADDIQFVERGSEHFFEGMVVDVKRSTKAQSKRDRCVIVRARVNGSFDAEIISTGELLINTPPNVIRIPHLPEDPGTRTDHARVYSVGQKVSCRAGAFGRWFEGFVGKVLPAGHYRIEFHDGSVDESVSFENLRPITRLKVKDTNKGKNTESSTAGFDVTALVEEYYVGQEVMMRFPFGCKWRVCTVTKVRSGGGGQSAAYDVLLNGRQESEVGVSAACLRHQRSLLYGYGEGYCPSKKSLARCASESTRPPQPPQSPAALAQSNNHPNQSRAFTNPQGEYALSTPQGKTSARQVEDSNSPAVGQQSQKKMPFRTGVVATTNQTPLLKKPPQPRSGGLPSTPHPTHTGGERGGRGEGVTFAMRDRFTQEMHRNVSLLNTSATERKFARIIRQERCRMDSAVRIQCFVRGCIVRARMALVSRHCAAAKRLLHDELNLSSAQVDLMERYMQALSAAIFKNQDQDNDTALSPGPDTGAMNQIAELISSTNHYLEVDVGHAEELNKSEEESEPADVTDPIERMKVEMLCIHRQQLQQQGDEMKAIFAQELRGLGTQIAAKLNNNEEEDRQSSHHNMMVESYASAVESFRHSGVLSASLFQLEESQETGQHLTHTRSRTSTAAENNDGDEGSARVFGIDETVIQDIGWMKDMYLDIWENSTLPSVEVVGIVAKSSTQFTFMEASLSNQLRDVMHGGGGFATSNHLFFVKDSDNKDDFVMIVQMESAAGRPHKLKCLGDKVADLCVNKKTVRISIDSKNQFEISSTSLRLDRLSGCLERLWDAHIAWMAQHLLIRIALHRVIQGISALFVAIPPSPPTEAMEEDEGGRVGVEVGAESDDMTPRPSRAVWLSHRYILFEELSSILKSGREQHDHYQETVTSACHEIALLAKNWGSLAWVGPDSDIGNEVSDKLFHLAQSLFAPYEVFFSSGGAESMVDSEVIRDHLQATHNKDTIQPILKSIYLSFALCFSVEDVFEDILLSPLLTASHQTLVTAYAYAETYEWQSLCAHSRIWAYLLQGREVDLSSSGFQGVYDRFMTLVLTTSSLVCSPALESPQQRSQTEGGLEGGHDDQCQQHHQVITAIEEFTSQSLMKIGE